MTYTKAKLKNMFLLKLAEAAKPGSGVSHGADSIIPTLGSESQRLTKDERDLAYEGFEELKLEGLITQDPNQRHSPVFTKLTDKGKKHLDDITRKGLDFSRHKIELNNLVDDKELLESCESEFNNDRYWVAVRNALIHLEIRVRRKAGLPQELVGAKLMSEAFNKTNGKLICLAATTEEEREGFNMIMMGIMKYHRNQKAHQEGTLERIEAIKIIGYLNYLLDVLETSTRLRDKMDEFF